MLKGAVYRSYARPAIFYGSETWCLKDIKMKFCKVREIHQENNVWSTAQR